MGRIAKEENCQFMLVCGDAFESNQVDRKTVARALEALKDVPVPVSDGSFCAERSAFGDTLPRQLREVTE